jgi:hypothetical protein
MPKRGAGGRGSNGSAGRSSAGHGPAEVVPALEQGADPAVKARTDKYIDSNPRDTVVAVNEAHVLSVNNALDTIQEAFPGGAGKES